MHKKQRGVVLVVSLIMLLLMTLLSVSAMKTSLMEEKMAGNSRDVELAFQAAETGLRDAELWIASLVGEPEANNTGSNRVWVLNSMDPVTTNPDNWWQEQNETWWLNNAEAYGSAIDGFPDCDPFEAWTKALSSKLFGGIGIYFDTKDNDGIEQCMIHADLRINPLIWLRDKETIKENGGYMYDSEPGFYKKIMNLFMIHGD